MPRLIAILIAAFVHGFPASAPAAPSTPPSRAPLTAPPVRTSPAAPDTPPLATTAPSTQQWLADFPKFVEGAGGTHWIVGRSSATCVTEREAFDQARRDASAQVRDLLRNNLTGGGIFKSDADAWMKSRVSRELSLGNLIVDRAVRRVHRPYGDIWSGAVLVNASPDRLAPIVRDYDAWRNGRTTAVTTTSFSLLGLSLAILAIYAVMNVLTRGYFRGRLRAGAGLALGLGATLLIWLARASG